MQAIRTDEAKTRLDDLIYAAVQGETVLITADGNQVVQLVPVQRERKPRVFGSAKGLIRMRDDFDEPLDDFKEYME